MDFLKALGINDSNSGTCSGAHGWSDATDAGTLDSINPTTGDRIARVFKTTPDDYETVIQDAQTAQHHWRQIPAPKRGEVIRQLGYRLREFKDPLGSLVAYEMGKSKQEGDGEVQEMIDMADFAVGQSRMLYGQTMHSERPLHRMYEQWHPLGIVGVISAFNFPVAVWSWNAFIAAICGNTVVWKPSFKTPLCGIAVQHLCDQIMKENDCPGIFSLINTDDTTLAEHFVADPRIDLVSFTGSTKVGRLVNENVARRLGRSLLELSGNNALIIDDTADLNLAVPAIVFGAVGTAGQRCTSTRRLFIHEKLYDPLVKELKNAYQQITIGDPLNQSNLMGPLIDQAAVDDYTDAIAQVRASGGELLFGGNRLERAGFFVEPALVAAQNDWPIVQQETFAPILYVMKFSDLSEAIAQQNHAHQGLSSALFTQNLSHAETFLSALGSDCGIANINIGTSGAEIGAAFGGEKDTGGGREAGSDAWKAYMRRQTNTINWGHELPLAQGIEFTLGK